MVNSNLLIFRNYFAIIEKISGEKAKIFIFLQKEKKIQVA